MMTKPTTMIRANSGQGFIQKWLYMISRKRKSKRQKKK